MAYFRVHSLAVSPYFCLSVLYIRAISGTRGSSGFGSVSKEHIDKRTAMKTEHAWVMIGNKCMCHGQNWWIGKLLPQQKGNSNKQVLKSFLKVLQPFHKPFESNKHLKIVTAILQMKHLYADFSRQERRYMSDLCDCYMHNISCSWIESAFDYCCASETYFRILNSFCEVSLLHQDFASLIYTEIIIVSKSLRNVTDHGGNQTPVPSQSWFRKQRLCMSCKNCHHK